MGLYLDRPTIPAGMTLAEYRHKRPHKRHWWRRHLRRSQTR